MVELITVAFSPVNLVFTVLLLLMIVYWVTVIIGVLDVDLFNIELPESGPEVDADVDVDVDADVDADGELDIGGTDMTRSILHFFYIGEVPVMVLLSVLILSLWTLSMLGNYYLNPARSFAIAIPIFFGDLVASLFIVKVFAAPLRRFYALLNKDYNAPRHVMGRICSITTTQVSKQKMGQASVRTAGAPIVLNVRSQDDHVFEKGDEAVIVKRDEKMGVYLIAPVNLEE